MANTITMTGHLGDAPSLRFTQSGSAVLSGSVADTPRRYNRDTGEWENAGDTLWLQWSIFGPDAEALADAGLDKGNKVTVTGKLKQRSYTTREGQERTVVEINADSVAIHAKAQGNGRGAGWSNEPKPQSTEDPWATPSTNEAPF